MKAVARIFALVCFVSTLVPHVHAATISPNPGDPLFCQPQEGVAYLIVNGGSGVFTANPDCYNNNTNNDTALSITTSQNGTLTGTVTSSAINYVYTPPTAGFTGLDTFSIPVTTVWNSAGGTGSAGGTARPGGPATLTVTLNVLPASVALVALGPTLVAVPAGSISSCSAPGNASEGPAAGAVVGCVTGIVRGSVAPSHGTLTTSGNTLLYTPATAYNGTDTFTYQAVGVNTDGSNALNSGDITVNVTDQFLDFTFASSGAATMSVMPGHSNSIGFEVTPTDGSYPGPVTFAATGLPPGATASFNPTSIAANGGAQAVTMTITAAPVAQAALVLGRPLAPLALALLLLPFAGRMRSNGRRMGRMLTVLLLLAGAAATAALSGCGQHNGYFMQPPQNYTVTVTATATPSSGSVLQHNATVTLQVQ